MSLLDKAKGAAKTVGEKAKEGAEATKEKVHEQKTKRRIDNLKEELGGVVYLQRTAVAPADAEAQITRIVSEIRTAEAELAE